ncbi:MAG: magnesium transporter CorA family protein [Acidimicrobiales bacterium]
MIDCWWFPPDQPTAQRIDIDSLPGPDTGVVWVDAMAPDAGALADLAQRLGLDPLLVARLGRRQPRHQLSVWGNARHAVLPACSLRADADHPDVGAAALNRPGDSDDAGELRLLDQIVVRTLELTFTDRVVLTIRWPEPDGDDGHTGHDGAYPLDGALASFASSVRNGGPQGLFGFLWALFDQLAEDVFAVVDLIDSHLDAAEDVVFEDDPNVTIPKGLFALRRNLSALRRASSAQRDVVSVLLRTDRDLIDDTTRMALERVYDHMLRVVELVEGQRDLLAGLLDAHLAMSANHTNEVMKRTSSWGAILVVATLVVGYYGMNFASIPELEWQYGWVWALGLIVAVTGGLYAVFKRKGWL